MTEKKFNANAQAPTPSSKHVPECSEDFLKDCHKAYQVLLGFFREQSLDIHSDFKLSELKQILPETLRSFSKSVQDRIYEEVLGLGPLKALIENTQVDEIIVTGFNSINYEIQGHLYTYADTFLNEHNFKRCLDTFSKSFFKAVSFENPTGNGQWKNFRVHILAPPLSPVYNLSLRRSCTHKINTLDDLVTLNSLQSDEKLWLIDALNSHQNILISGATSSGKTTFIQCLLNQVTHERCLILEDAKELNAPNLLSTHLLCPTRSEQYMVPISMSDLVKESLRMRPDRLILGEARGAEAKDYIQALSTGHRGCLASIHASSPKEALLRLECLILQGAPQWPSKVVRQLIKSGVDYVVQLKKDEQGHRKITSLERVATLEEGHISLEPAYLKKTY